ncbi:hypothetical protein AB0J83_38490 [Actinoplanes sp. NPDC049596]|uniref:hypothetical protein n=1 Tax=unclassified Actinoplanes TaxID=2626549 RepID=UPI00343A6006
MALTPGSPGSPDPAENEAMVLVGREQRGGAMTFELQGRGVRGLYPGAVKQMRVTVVNPSAYRLRLHRIDGRVVSSSRRGCPATSASLLVKAYNGRLPQAVEPRSRTTLAGTVPVTMPSGATTKCAGAHFTIALTGAGWQEGR